MHTWVYNTHTYTYRYGSLGVTFKSGEEQGVQPRCGPHGLTSGPCVRVSHRENEEDTQPCLRGSGEDGVDTCQAMPTVASTRVSGTAILGPFLTLLSIICCVLLLGTASRVPSVWLEMDTCRVVVGLWGSRPRLEEVGKPDERGVHLSRCRKSFWLKPELTWIWCCLKYPVHGPADMHCPSVLNVREKATLAESKECPSYK